MLSDTEIILETYTKVELAFLAKYRLASYMQETRAIIQAKLDACQLDEAQIKIITDEIESNSQIKRKGIHCPRCFSDKTFFRQVDVEAGQASSNYLDSTNYRTDIIKENVRICEICGYDFTSNSTGSFFKKLFNFLTLRS